MKRLLVIDDEADIVELLSYNLTREGFSVDTACDGEAALELIRAKSCYDLIVLDLMLPGIQGLELCRMIRGRTETSLIPIVMLTAKGDVLDRVLGLEMGADDYITKPFSPRELVARVKAVLRRAEQSPISQSGDILTIREMIIDREKYTVTVGERTIKLSATEFRLLLYLAERPGRICRREHLLNAVWGDDVFIEPRTVDVHIRRLRTKMEQDPNDPQYIKTMRGIGYFIET